MAKENYRNIRLGLFIIIGTISLVTALYFIGTKKNLFGSTFKISAEFHNVNGLTKGNNVRFGGIDVGTVESVEIVSDSSMNVVMIIQKNARQFIKKNAVVSIGTEGLMGNKLVNINAGKENSSIVEEGDVLQSSRPVEMDEMVGKLNISNENIRVISTNLRTITDKINSKNNLWNLLMDTVVAENVKSAVVNLKLMSSQGVSITGNLKGITDGIKKGKGTIGALIMDTLLSSRINQTIVKLEKISDTAAIITGDISHIVNQLKQGKGSIGVLLNDTTLIHNLNKSIESIDNGAGSFNENMEALKHSWPFKKYYRKQKKPIRKTNLMELTIQSIHFTSKQELNNFVNEKVSRLSHFYDKIESAKVCLKLDKSDKTENKVCEIRLAVPGNDLFVKRQCKTFEEATNEAVDALQQQIKRMKSKFETH